MRAASSLRGVLSVSLYLAGAFCFAGVVGYVFAVNTEKQSQLLLIVVGVLEHTQPQTRRACVGSKRAHRPNYATIGRTDTCMYR